MNRPSIALGLMAAIAGLGMSHANAHEVSAKPEFDPGLIMAARRARISYGYVAPHSRNNQRQRRKRAAHARR